MMYNRIKEVRKRLGLSQQEFAERLSISRSNLGNIETGAISVTSRVIESVCREYSVNEAWLRTGEGEMFREMSREEEIAKFVGAALADESESFRKRFLTMLSRLNTEEWAVLEKMALDLADKEKKG
jgi:transcriptional regulator with XRE-family HTH domain